jgi:ferric-dicitrate binding protein FerR (iron transport regulator)
MIDDRHPPDPQDDSPTPSEETLARLLRLSGPRPAVPELRTSRVREAAHTQWRRTVKSRERRRGLFWLAGALAAAALLALAIGLRGQHPFRPASLAAAAPAQVERVEGSVRGADRRLLTAGDTVFAGTPLETGDQGRAALRLATGSSLRVDVNTRMKWISGSTLELIEGALYVDTDSRKGGENPLEIVTRWGRVRERGTQFEVRLAEARLRVSVREGVATLSHAGRSYEAQEGFRLTLDPLGAPRTDPIPLHGQEWDWVLAIAPSFQLEGRTLGEFLEWVARETRWEVRFTDASAAERQSGIVLHGSVEGLRPDQMPATVLPTCGLRFHLDGNTLFIDSAEETGR